MHNTLSTGKTHRSFSLPVIILSFLVLMAMAHTPLWAKDTDSLQPPAAELPAVQSTEIAASDTLVTLAESTMLAFTPGQYSKQDVRRGERLFKGLVPFNSGQHDCASCHYTKPLHELNWNPSVVELAQVWNRSDNYNLMQVMNMPLGPRMMEDHAGMIITLEEEHQLQAYFEQVLEQGMGDLQAYPVKAFIFWGLGALMLLALIDLFLTRKIKFKALHILVLLAGIAVHGQMVMAEAQNLGRTPNYAPDQPIKFSHLIHAGENEIDCRYCHHIADVSPSAGIPSNNVCMNCHNVVRNGSNSGRFEINKIHAAAESGQAVQWIRIHKLPDHSFFSHAQHVNAGKLDCSECHGKVEEMHLVFQVEDLSMGWCLSCHRDKNVDFLANPYYQIYEKLHQKIKNGEIDAVTAAQVGGEDCMKCHY